MLNRVEMFGELTSTVQYKIFLNFTCENFVS